MKLNERSKRTDSCAGAGPRAERQTTSKRRRRVVWAALPLLPLGLWLAFCNGSRTVPEPLASAPTLEPRSTPTLSKAQVRTALEPRVVPSKPAAAAPIIERVSIDRSVACRNEPLRIDVLAHMADGDDSGLLVSIDGRPGNPGVTTFASAGDRVVPVLVYDRARQGELARRELNVTIRDCDAPDQLLEIEARERPQDGAQLFVARLPEGAEADVKLEQALRQAALSWDFGDGVAARAGAATVHHYPEVQIARTMRSFVVSVETNIAGRRFRGVRTVSFHSEYLSNKQRGTITPEVRVGAVRSSDGGYSAALEITHFEPAALQLEAATVSFARCEGGAAGDSPGLNAGAERYLSGVQLAPGRSRAEMRVPASEIPAGSCLAQIAFTGRAATGEAVYMTAAMGLAPNAPEAERTPGESNAAIANSGHRSADPTEERALTRALTLLGRELRNGATVTEEELALLKDHGSLAQGSGK